MTVNNGGGSRDERFEALYRKHYARVYRFYLRARLMDDEAHDCAQEAFTRVFQGIDQYRGEAEWSFLETVARNVLLNRIRAQKTGKRKGEVVAIDDPQIADELPAVQELDYAEREQQDMHKRRIRVAMASLTDAQRECLQLRLDDLSYSEIQQTLGITIDAVKSRLRDAKKQLKDKLGPDAETIELPDFPEDEE